MAWIGILISTICVLALIFFAPMWRATRGQTQSIVKDEKKSPEMEALKSDLEVQLARLQNVQEDEKSGRLDAQGAEAAEAEVGRKILRIQAQLDKLVNQPKKKIHQNKSGLRIWGAVTILTSVAALGIYGFLGNPELQGQGLSKAQLEQRKQVALAVNDVSDSQDSDTAINARLNEAEFLDLVQNARENPQNFDLQRTLARAFMQQRNYEAAIGVYRELVTNEGRTPDNLTSLAEALLNQSRGEQSAEPSALLKEAVALDTMHKQARFYLAAIDTQKGDWTGAAQKWLDLIATSEGNENWLPIAARSLADVEAQIFEKLAAGPDAQDVRNAATMSAEDRAVFVASMVQNLQERLISQGGGVTEWVRLVRSYDVLDDAQGRANAIAAAKKALSAPAALKSFEILVALGA